MTLEQMQGLVRGQYITLVSSHGTIIAQVLSGKVDPQEKRLRGLHKAYICKIYDLEGRGNLSARNSTWDIAINNDNAPLWELFIMPVYSKPRLDNIDL